MNETVLYNGIYSTVIEQPEFLTESLILAQNERWQRGLGMQVERDLLTGFFG